MRRAAAFGGLVAVALMAGCLEGPTPGPTPRPPQTPAAAHVGAPVALTPAPNMAGNVQNGRALFTAKGCAGCHEGADVPAKPSLVGPNLANVTLRPTIAGEQIQNTPDNLVRWIIDPPAMKPGTAMPKLGLSEQEARDLAAFLYALPYNPGR